MRDNRYDAILHLVTAADGAESFYTLTNNVVRKESNAEAREMDKKTLDCWTGHEHLYIVDNSTGFDEKVLRRSEHLYGGWTQWNRAPWRLALADLGLDMGAHVELVDAQMFS